MILDRIKVKTALLRQGMSQKELAEKTGLTTNTVSNAVNGREAKAETAVKIADALGCRVVDLREDKKTAEEVAGR